MKMQIGQAFTLARDAALGAGASVAMAESLARATLAAESAGHGSVGFAHLPDYLNGLRCGRINGQRSPRITFPAPAFVQVDVQQGIAQLGFDQVFEQLVQRCNGFGMATLALRNSFTTGELSYYTRRLAEAGLVALACTNAGAHVTTPESGKPLFGTNPLSFAAPRAGTRPVVLDQSSSATAFVNVRRAAENGEAIPQGWALDRNGMPTTDAREAMNGLLLPFGGQRGANIALMVEVLSAGLGGGNWSTDAPSFADGNASPAVSLLVVAFAPQLLDADFCNRLEKQLQHLQALGLHIPGRHLELTELDIPDAVLSQIQSFLA